MALRPGKLCDSPDKLEEDMPMDLVITIAPTFIETPMTKPFFEEADFRDLVPAKIKLGRLRRVEDVTGAVVYLASDASGLVTGSSVVIDGGWTAD
jgi:NAD(P)-dependent dehydrogenase (short-subunit alcohol dehydrogenase family)